MRGTPGRSSLARKIESFTRGFISTRVQLSLCQCVTPRGTFARHAFGARSIRRVRVPIIGKATFFSFSLSLSFSLYFFLLTSVEFLRCSPRVKVLRSSYTRKLVRGESVFTSTFWKSVSGGIESDSWLGLVIIWFELLLQELINRCYLLPVDCSRRWWTLRYLCTHRKISSSI